MAIDLSDIEEKILRSMDLLAVPLSRAFIADGIHETFYKVDLTIKNLLARRIIQRSDDWTHNRKGGGERYILTSQGHAIIIALLGHPGDGRRKTPVRSFLDQTLKRGSDYA